MINSLLKKEWNFPNLSGKRILIVGLGGGSDIISAFSLISVLPNVKPEDVILANCKTSLDYKGVELVSANTPHIGMMSNRTPSVNENYPAGPLKIEMSLPRGPRNTPWLIACPRDFNAKTIALEITSFKFDVIIGVDTGGDALADTKSSHLGRDERMLEVLKRTQLPIYVVIVAPGSDGQSSFENLLNPFKHLDKAGDFLGSFSLLPLIPLFKTYGDPLRSESFRRTPTIIVDAFEDHLDKKEGGFLVPRERRPVIPKDFLTRAFVFFGRSFERDELS